MKDDETISVKGIKKEIYENIKEIAKNTGKTIGEITNEAYKMFLSATTTIREAGDQFISGLKESTSINVSNIDNLEISGDEIKKFGKKISFANIKNLKIMNINEQDFENYVVSIINVEKLEIPKELNRLKVLERCKFIGKIETF